MKLNELSNEATSKRGKRLGRGIGSGKGKTSGRGHKGQKSRAGATIKGFEGGQMPIHRRLPKRGFVNNISKIVYETVNLGDLQKFIDNKKIDAKKTLNKELLLSSGIINQKDLPVKLLAKGEIKQAVKIEVDAASESAKAAIEKAGGSVSVLAKKKEKKAA